MKMKVLKTDGSIEQYIHTKVLSTINKALSAGGGEDSIFASEQLAEVVTYYVHTEYSNRLVTSGEIFSIVKAVLVSTEYVEAATGLNRYHYMRKLGRGRLEVASIDVQHLSDAESLCGEGERSRWDKSRIVEYLVGNYEIERQTARAIASTVEEKILSMCISRVPVSLIKQLVLSDAAAMLEAHRELEGVAG